MKGTQSWESNKLWLLDLPSNNNIDTATQPTSAAPATTNTAATATIDAHTQPTTTVPAPTTLQQPSTTTQLADAAGQPTKHAALAAAVLKPDQANIATNQASATPAELVKFAHAALFSPFFSLPSKKPWTRAAFITFQDLLLNPSKSIHPNPLR